MRVHVHDGPNGTPSTVFELGSSFKDMAQWREDQRTAFADEAEVSFEPKKLTGFAGDAVRYLAAVQAMPSYRDRERDIQHWVDVFGQKDRRTIKPADIRAQLAIWANSTTRRGATLSASALKHRLTALQHLWTVLDGAHARNPVKEVPRPTQPDPKPRDLPYAVVDAILGQLPRCKTRARLEVLAYTGIPFATQARITPSDIDLDRRRVYLAGRKKGKGTKAGWRRLTARGAHAFERFIREEAFGKASSGSWHQVFIRARDKAAADLKLDLSHVRPYDFRHAFAVHVLTTTGDIRATQELLGHTNLRTTELYTQSGVSLRVDKAIALLDQ